MTDYTKIFLLRGVVNDTESQELVRLQTDMAIEWIKANTAWIEGEEITLSMWYFIDKFISIMELPVGVVSESIANMPIAYATNNDALIRYWANEFLGGILKSNIRMVVARSRWS